MLLYTRAYFNKLIHDFNLAAYCFNVISPLIYIAYLLYAIFLPVGFMWANISLLCLTVLYLVFYLVTYDLKEKKLKNAKKRVKHIFRGLKLSVSGMTLGITIYGIYVATTHTSVLSVVLSCFMALFWVIQLAVELISYVIEYQAELFLAAIERDKDELIRPITSVGNFVKRVTGKEPEPPKEPKKILKVLDGRVEEMRNNKKSLFGIFSKKRTSDTPNEPIETPSEEVTTK